MNQYYDYLNLGNIRTNSLLVMLVGILSVSSTSGWAELEHEEEVAVVKPDPVHVCGMKLLKEAGKTGPETESLPGLYSRASIDRDSEFLSRMLSIIYVESAFNKKAKSHADAHGLMQMTEIAVKDAIRHCNLRPVAMDNLFDSYTNIKYGTCYLSKLLKETNGDWDRALVAYNGGYAQLQKYDRGEAIASETANYVLKVNRAYKICMNPS